MNLLKSTLATASVMAFAIPASAEINQLTSSMDGAQANAGAGSGSPGIGSAALTFDTVTKNLTWNITWSGLTGTPTAMHFHGPALPNQPAAPAVSAGVNATPPRIGSAILSPAHESDMLAGLWYLLLHTTTISEGEIRGQVLVATPSPSISPLGIAILLSMLGATAYWRLRDSASAV